MTPSTARSNPIRRLARSQSPATVTVELLFALLLVAAFWYTRNSSFFANRTQPAPTAESPAQAQSAPGAAESAFLPRLAGFDPKGVECRQLVVNGSFEEMGGWQLPLTARPAAYTDEQASEGSRSLRLGIWATDQPAYSESQASQTIEIPAGVQSLALAADVQRSAAGEGSDRQFLQVRTGGHTHTLFNERVDLSGWQPVIYDLTPLAGSRVELVFGVFNSGGPGRAAMAVDNVRLYACGLTTAAVPPETSAPSATVTDVPTPLVDNTAAPMQTAPPVATPTTAIQPASTPTEALTTPPACTELVANGDFESSGGWMIPNTPHPARFATEPVWAGSRSLGMGIASGQSNLPSDSTAYQPITLPGGNVQITLRASIWRAGSGGGDFHYIWVSSEGKTNRVLQGLDDFQRWEEMRYDLTPLAGKRIFLLLGVFNDGVDGVASMFVDSVSVQVCTDPTPTPSTPATVAATLTPVREQLPPASVGYASPAPMGSPDFGVNVFLWGQDGAAWDLQLVQDAGFRWVRQSFAWDVVQPGLEEGATAEADALVAQVNGSDLLLLAHLDLKPDNPAFVEFAAALAQRYNCTTWDRCVHAWQVGNEPNLSSQWGGQRPDPAAYAALLGQVYSAIKAANPNALVISAGMAPTATDREGAMSDIGFYQEMYAAMGGSSEGYFDLLGVNAPGFAAPPETSPDEAAALLVYGGQRVFAFRHVEDVRQIMEANGDREKRIAVLEFGWTSDPVNPETIWFGADAGIDEFVKADYLRRAYSYAAQNWRPWIGLMSVRTMPDRGWLDDGNPLDEELYWWAILEPGRAGDLRLRPAFVALCRYFRGLDGQECPYSPH